MSFFITQIGLLQVALQEADEIIFFSNLSAIGKDEVDGFLATVNQ
jgi:hypothetical protein